MRSRSQRIQSHHLNERRRAPVGSRLAGPVLAALVWILGGSADALAQQTFVVTRADDPAPGACLVGDCSLREAIIAANADAAADTITFVNLMGSPDVYTLSIGGSGEDLSITGDLDILQPLIIQGNAPSETIIQAGASTVTGIDRVFHVGSAVSVTFDGVTIRHGNAVGNGGGIFSNFASAITVSNAVVEDNEATSGGGIFVSSVSSQLTLSSAVVSGNDATAANGGGILCDDCVLDVMGSTISGNSAAASGGGLYVASASAQLTMDNSQVTGNQATTIGGGVAFDGTAIPQSITATNITGNDAPTNGGGISLSGNTGAVVVNLNRISGNTTMGVSGIWSSGVPSVDATLNWWGCDDFPGAMGCDDVSGGLVIDDPRIDLRLIADPPAIPVNGTSTLTADLTFDSDGIPLPGAPAAALEGLVVTFDPGSFGNVVPPTAPITNGTATTTFTGTSVGNSVTSATLDNGTEMANVNVVARPTLTISGVTMAEGSPPPGGTTPFLFTVTRSHNQTALSVDFATADGTASVTPGNDYQQNMGTLNFAAGASEPLMQTIPVLVNQDDLVELDETFFVNLLNPVDADITVSPGVGTIVNDDAATLAINDVMQAEGASTTTATFTFNVTLTGNVDTGVSVDFATADGTATVADGDYMAANGTLMFSGTSGQMQMVSVTVNGDDKVELDEAFFVNLSNIQAGGRAVSFSDDQGLGTIQNDDQAGISINDVSQNEGDSGTSPTFTFTVTLDAEVDVPVDVPFETQNGSAIASSDYQAANGTIMFPVGPAGQQLTIDVTVNGDDTVEPNETFFVVLTGINAMGRNVVFTRQPGLGTILNDDASSLSINDVSQDENFGVFTFAVTLNGAVAGGFTVDFATADGTALVGDNDYNAAGPATLTFAGTAGEQMFIPVTVNDDAKVELDETFLVNLSNLQAGGLSVTIADGQGVGTIQNDDAATISINNVTVNEGAGGATTNFVFDVTMTAVVDTLVTVDFATADGSATTGDGDYVANAASVSFVSGSIGPQTITVTVNNDAKVELNETFNVNLSNIQAGGRQVTFLDNQGVGTILNDDQARIIIADVTQNEGNAGPTNFAFTATLLDNVDAMVMVDFMTSDSTATVADNDYTAATGTITFNGAAGNPQTINVAVTGDTKVELNETFVVQLSNIQAGGRNVVFTDDVAVGNVINDDSAGLSIDDVALNEGATGEMPLLTFTVTLSADLFAPLTVDFATANGTATASSDYTANNGTLNFAGTAGEQHTIDVTVTGDDTVENDETLFVNLSNIVAGGQDVSFTKQQGTGTITNDDAATLSINDLSMAEGAGPFQFTVTLSAAVAGGLTVDFATADGTATVADNDYTATNGPLVFAGAAGEQKQINVTVNGDSKVELDETFSVTLAQSAGIPITVDPAGAGTILNDDSATVSIGNATVGEGAGGATTNFVFDVTLSAAVDVPVSVDFTTVDGTATTGDGDYNANAGAILFVGNAGEVQTITVTINDDAKVELDETFNVDLSNIQATGRSVSFADPQGLGTIVDDDAATITIDDVTLQEGSGGGTTTFSFNVTLDVALGDSVTVDFATADDTATTADNDYPASNGTLTFTGAAGTQTIDVDVTADTKVEPTETFFVNLSNLQAGGLDVTLADTQALGTIVTDDGATISINDVSVNEGPQGTPTTLQFTVTLSAAVANPVSVNFATADITAMVGDGDYAQTSGTLNFVGTEGETQLINVPVNGDNKVELDETLAVNLSNLQAGGLMVAFAKQQGIGTILNDDGMASISINNVTLNEGSGGGSTIFNFTVTLDKQVGGAISVDFATADGSAKTGDSDYTPANGTLNFAGTAGEQRPIAVTVSADDVAELDEMFFVNLSNLQAGGLPVVFANQQGIGTILNDDDIGACGFPNNLVIDGQVFSGTETVVACQTITAGPNVQILSSANVLFQAGESVILANGFFVEMGGVFAVEIDPSLLVP